MTKRFTSSAAGLCALRLLWGNSSRATVSWDANLGHFDSHRDYTAGLRREGFTCEASVQLAFSASLLLARMLFLIILVFISHSSSKADVVSVRPNTELIVTVTAASSTNRPAVSRILSNNETVAAPTHVVGEPSGSNGIILTWRPPDDISVEAYIIRYKEVCPYPDTDFKSVTVYDIEILLNTFLPGSTYGIQVAAATSEFVGLYSKTSYVKTLEAAPGLVTNLTAVAVNHTFVMVTWFLPRRINGLITKFALKVKHARTSQTVRMLELNAEDIMAGALPHCNDAADILTRGTTSPAEMTASAPSITESAVPPAAAWSVPISVGVDQLRPNTAYLFEVSAFNTEGEGQVASSMVRMNESGTLHML
ncbi:unnamed protein product [Arctogadus glacialis]